MKLAFGMIVFNGNYVLEETLKNIYPYASQILIAEGPVTFWQQQGFTTSTDGTNEVLDNFPDPENKIRITHSQFNEKDDQCQAYMKFLNRDIDYLWNLDSDEVFKTKDIETVITLLKTKQYSRIDFQSISFFGGFDNYLTGFEERAEFRRIFKVYPGAYWKTHRPPTMSRDSKFAENHLNYKVLAQTYNIRMYHYSYVFADQVFQKVKYYTNTLGKLSKAKRGKSIFINNYFNNIWLPWVLGNRQQQLTIENKYKGVHEFIPSYRKDCYTAPFKSNHPKIIQDNMPKLIKKLNEQQRSYII